MKPTALVTGANGFTGSRFCQYLAHRGVGTRGMYYEPDGAPSFRHDRLELVPGDLRDRESLRRALEGVSVVYHIGALYRPTNVRERDYWDVNVEGTRNLIELSKEVGVSRFVNCSTIGVHGHVENPPAAEDAPIKPDDYYQVSKLKGEEIARDLGKELGLKVASVRPAAIYGPGETRFLKLARLIHQRRFVMFGDGEVEYHFIHWRDLSDAFVRCAEQEAAVGQTYIIADDHPLTLNQIVNTVADALGVRRPRVRLPLSLLKVSAVMCEFAFKPLRLSPPIHRRRAAWFSSCRSFDITKARRELGYEPNVAPEDGLADMVRSYRAAGWLDGGQPGKSGMYDFPVRFDEDSAPEDAECSKHVLQEG